MSRTSSAPLETEAHGDTGDKHVNPRSGHIPRSSGDALDAAATNLIKRGFSDRELSEIKIELGSKAYRHPRVFDSDRHYVAREIVRRAIDVERDRVLRLVVVWWDGRLTDEQFVNELGFGEDEVPTYLGALLRRDDNGGNEHNQEGR